MSSLIDISVPLGARTPVFEGNPPIALNLDQSLAAGDEANVSSLSLGVHSGTHVDAPFHFLPDGSAVEEVPLDACVGQALVVDATPISGHIDASHLAGLRIPEGCTRLLVKTSNSALWSRPEFTRDFQALTADGAAYLAERGIRLLGWDYLSVGPYGDAVDTHRLLLQAGIVILEGIDLSRVAAGEYELLCLPLAIEGSDGAPCRAVLRF